MKKHGFTLAEVLITLAIIGVVASLTLPSLMTNTAEQQAVTAFRKAINTLSEVGQMSAAVDGFDYGGLNTTMTPGTASTIDANGAVIQSLWAMMTNRAQVDRSLSGTSILKGECSSTYTSNIFFADGTSFCYQDAKTNGSTYNKIQGWIDTNGVKGPNKKFECSAATCKPGERTQGDQFPITLNGSTVYPGHVSFSASGVTSDTSSAGQAAAWALRK